MIAEKKKRIRMQDTDKRKNQILDNAIEIAIKHGYKQVTRCMVAEKIGCSPALVSKYFFSMEKLKKEILTAAIRREILPIIAEGIAAREKRFKGIHPLLKQKALEYIKSF